MHMYNVYTYMTTYTHNYIIITTQYKQLKVILKYDKIHIPTKL